MDWLQTASGKSLLSDESRRVAADLDDVFGEQLLVLGDWAGARGLGEHARTKRVQTVGSLVNHWSTVCGQGECLPIQSDSIDAVLAPHALEMTRDPHGMLREIDRVLRPEGAVLITGFNSLGLWGLRHALSRNSFPPDCRQLISERRVSDWLRLLGFRLEPVRYFHYAAPLNIRKHVPEEDFADERGGALPQWRVLAGAYSVKARKQVVGMTPLKPSWRRRPRMVAGLVNPTTRNAA